MILILFEFLVRFTSVQSLKIQTELVQLSGFKYYENTVELFDKLFLKLCLLKLL